MPILLKKRIITGVNLATFVISFIIVLGWILKIPALSGLMPGVIMRFNLAVYLVFFISAVLSVQNSAKSEERYHSLVEQATDAIYVTDTNRNFTEVNISMCEMTGYTKHELLGMNVTEILDPEELKNNPLPSLSSYLGKPPVERRFIKKNGEYFIAEINVKVFSDNRVMVIARDVTYRNKMLQELQEAELKFKTIAEKSMVGIYLVQNDKFIYVNPRFAEIFGYQPEELINSVQLDTIIYDTHRDYTTRQVKLRMEGKIDSVRYETKGKKKDGSSNWVEFCGSIETMNGVPTIIGSVMDVTERKRTGDELKASELKYKMLFENSPVPLWMLAYDSFKIIAANKAAAKHYGYTRKELIGLDITAMRLPEDRDLQVRGYDADRDTTPIVQHVKKDGTKMMVQLTTHDIVIEGIPLRLSQTTDITEQYKAEELLKKSETNLKAILNTTDTAYGLFDNDLNALMFNSRATTFFNEQYGHIPEINSHISEYFNREQYPQLYKFTNKVLNGENINFEVNYPQKDGSTLWYYARLFPITGDSNEILGLLMALYDITERKNAEQNLQIAYEHIQSHINNIKDMAWKQSHLIRSPLANLKGLTTMLKTDADPEIVGHIKTELDRMDAIIIEMAEDATDKG